MVLMILLTIIGTLINLIFSILPNLPQVPDEFSSIIDNFFDLIFSNSGLVGFFLPMNVVKIALPIALIIINFKHIYNLLKWIIAKIPLNTK